MYSYIGKSYPVHDAEEKARGAVRYLDDIKMPGMLYGRLLCSPRAHARVLSIDSSAAEALPGVRAVAHRFNSPDTLYNSAKRYLEHQMRPDENIFPPIVRHHGDRVAAVAAESEAIAKKALGLIKVEYEDLPLVLDVEEALAEDACPVQPGGNLLGTLDFATGNVAAALEHCDHVVEGRYTVPMIHHYAMEPHACLAHWQGGKLQVLTPTQNVFAVRLVLSEIFGLAMNGVQVSQSTVGGGFGSKYECVLEPVAAQLSHLCGGAPVRLTLDRKDTIIATKTRHAAVMYVKAGLMADGTVTALAYDFYVNAGAYAGSTMNIVACMGTKGMMLYHIPNMAFTGRGVYTNTPVGAAMRGYGSPQVIFALEMLMNKAAGAIGMDPAALRRKNLVVPGDMQPCNGASLGNARVVECLDRVCALAGWPGPAPGRDGDTLRGMGLACGVHGNGLYPKMIDVTTVTVRLQEDGTVTIYTGNQDMGQGLIQVILMVAAETLMIPPEQLAVIHSDTDYTNLDMGTSASRGTWMGGRATQLACEAFVGLLKKEAAALLGLAAEDCRLVPGGVAAQNNPANMATLRQIAIHGQQVSRKGELSVTLPYYSQGAPGTYAAHIAQVAVHRGTGVVTVEKYYAVHDAGQIINPMMAEGQIEGGVHMGLGYALFEELKVDPATGRVTNASAAKYPIVKADEMPPLVTETIAEGVQEHGPYGAKSCSEITVVPVAPAVLHAINNALGTQLVDLPATPRRVLDALEGLE